MTRLILVRHGESYANRRRIYVGHTDVELEENGFAQARLTAEYIAEHYKVDAVYASDLRRAFCTGKCISDRLGLPITPDRELREIYAGEWENVPFEELAIRHADTYSVWKNDIGHCACPGGETVAELAERVYAELQRIALLHDGETVVCASHATPLRAMQALVTYGTLDRMKDVPWATNASVSVLVYDGGSWHYELISHDEHLGDCRIPAKGKA